MTSKLIVYTGSCRKDTILIANKMSQKKPHKSGAFNL